MNCIWASLLPTENGFRRIQNLSMYQKSITHITWTFVIFSVHIILLRYVWSDAALHAYHSCIEALTRRDATRSGARAVWLVADGWCWFILREKYCWLVGGGWFVLREKYYWLVADKPSEHPISFLVSRQWRLLLLGPRRVGYRRTVYGVCHETSMLMVMW
jgi:hypothetical protein